MPAPDDNAGVVRRLIDHLRGHGLKPGDKLPSIRALADDFGVRPNVVRDALLHVQTLGLVRVLPRCGAFVQSLDITPLGDALADTLHTTLAADEHNLFHVIDARVLLEVALAVAGRTATGWMQAASAARAAAGCWCRPAGCASAPRSCSWPAGPATRGGLALALAGFGFGKGLYDANIWAAVFDAVPAGRRRAAARPGRHHRPPQGVHATTVTAPPAAALPSRPRRRPTGGPTWPPSAGSPARRWPTPWSGWGCSPGTPTAASAACSPTWGWRPGTR